MTLHSALVHLSKKCNLDCPFCYYSAGERFRGGQKEYNYGQWVKTLKKLNVNGFREMVFVGGEPTLLPYFKELLSASVYNFERVSIQTNATLPREDIISLASRIKREGNYEEKGVRGSYADLKFVVSIEDARREYNQGMRGRFQLEHAVYFIKLLKSRGIDNISLRVTLYQDNDVGEIIKLAEKLGVNLTFMRFYSLGRGKNLKAKVPDEERIYNIYKKILNYNKGHSNNILINSPIFYMGEQDLFKKYKGLFKKQPIACASAKHRVSITQDGSVFPCQMLHNTVELGNILEDDFSKIRKNAEEFREELLKKEPIDKCKDCPFSDYCNGGCMYYAYHNEKRGDPLCPIPRLLDESVIEVI